MTPADFRELASPATDRWRQLEFALTWRLGDRPPQSLHAWVERPDRVRVQSPSGEVLADERGSRDLFFANYYWAAMLQPAELATGVAVESVVLTEHAQRSAYEAVVRPIDGYQPRCSCCSLLPSDVIDPFEVLHVPRPDGFSFPDRFVVRLDVQTGVCVYIEAIGGTRSGVQHDMTILAAGH